jgi:hypothetical protein
LILLKSVKAAYALHRKGFQEYKGTTKDLRVR